MEKVPLEGEVPLEEMVHPNRVLLNVVQSKPALSMLAESMPVNLEDDVLLNRVLLNVVQSKPALSMLVESMPVNQGEMMENQLEVCRRGIKQQHHRRPQEGSVPDDKSRNIPEVVFVRRWAVGVLGIWREGVGWERGGSRWVSLSPTWV